MERRRVEDRTLKTGKSDVGRREVQDVGGEDVEFETEISRSELVAVVQPIILRSIEICKRVLKEKNLSRKAIEKIILVGGPQWHRIFGKF